MDGGSMAWEYKGVQIELIGERFANREMSNGETVFESRETPRRRNRSGAGPDGVGAGTGLEVVMSVKGFLIFAALVLLVEFLVFLLAPVLERW